MSDAVAVSHDHNGARGVSTVTEPVSPVAPLWHTILLLVLVAGVSIAGARNSHRGEYFLRLGVAPHMLREARYLLNLASQWVLLGYVVWGIRRRGLTLAALIGGRWPTARAVVKDVGVALVGLVSIWLWAAVVYFTVGLPHPTAALKDLTPHSAVEFTLWVLVSATAGFCEEVLFRGYLMRQLAAWTKRAWVAVVLQGVIFGLSHGYQGPAFMAMLSVVGCVFGVLAQWRRSLRPGIIAHGLQDAIAGLADLARP